MFSNYLLKSSGKIYITLVYLSYSGTCSSNILPRPPYEGPDRPHLVHSFRYLWQLFQYHHFLTAHFRLLVLIIGGSLTTAKAEESPRLGASEALIP